MPLTPSNAFTMIRILFPAAKPVAEAARPAQAFKSDMKQDACRYLKLDNFNQRPQSISFSSKGLPPGRGEAGFTIPAKLDRDKKIHEQAH